MTSTKLLDDEIAHYLNQLTTSQKQVVLVVLKTMSAQNDAKKNPASQMTTAQEKKL